LKDGVKAGPIADWQWALTLKCWRASDGFVIPGVSQREGIFRKEVTYLLPVCSLPYRPSDLGHPKISSWILTSHASAASTGSLMTSSSNFRTADA
jgi:hypothetical protein